MVRAAGLVELLGAARFGSGHRRVRLVTHRRWAAEIGPRSGPYVKLRFWLCKMLTMAMSLAQQRILRAMLDAADNEHYGLALMRTTGLKSGSLYPALNRLEKTGLVARRWEDIDPSVEGRPRRRLYRLTPDGVIQARQVLNQTAAQLGFTPTVSLR